MEQILFIFIAVLIIGNGILIWHLINKGKGVEKPDNDTGFKLILEQVNQLSRTMDAKISDSGRQMSDTVHRQFSESQKLIKEITKELAEVKETGKQVVSFAHQLQNLQDILKNPKQRGILGEYYLETLLKNVMAQDQYKMQYTFANGEIVDAAVFVKDKIIPIDSKFSLENYNRFSEEKNPAEKERLGKVFENDLKLRIQETAKYIRPNEGTMDFAFMFIPHEAIYYDLLVNKVGVSEDSENLIQRAANKYKVIIVSPTSFLAYLQTVLQGLNRMHIEEKAKDIVKRVDELGKHLRSYEEYHNKLGNSLSTVVNHFTSSSKEFKKIGKDVTRITGDTTEFEPIAIEKPEVE
ncbi:MAG: DNA recombination protein RmuC [Candidatus Taylorbacteria bacterium]|nr:DNA recombination protein RmuC [Candidatus Taylorbacteria bacterium]